MRNFLAQIVVLSVLVFALRNEGTFIPDNLPPKTNESSSNSVLYTGVNDWDVHHDSSQNINKEKKAINLVEIPDPAAHDYINDTAAAIASSREPEGPKEEVMIGNSKRMEDNSSVKPELFKKFKKHFLSLLVEAQKSKNDAASLANDWAVFFNITRMNSGVHAPEHWTLTTVLIRQVHLLLEFRNKSHGNSLSLLFLPTNEDSHLLKILQKLRVQKAQLNYKEGRLDMDGQTNVFDSFTLITSKDYIKLVYLNDEFKLLDRMAKSTPGNRVKVVRPQKFSRLRHKSRNMLHKVLAPFSVTRSSAFDSLKSCSEASMLDKLSFYHIGISKLKKKERYCLHYILEKHMQQWKNRGKNWSLSLTKHDFQHLENKLNDQVPELVYETESGEIVLVFKFPEKYEKIFLSKAWRSPTMRKLRRLPEHNIGLVFYPDTKIVFQKYLELLDLVDIGKPHTSRLPSWISPLNNLDDL